MVYKGHGVQPLFHHRHPSLIFGLYQGCFTRFLFIGLGFLVVIHPILHQTASKPSTLFYYLMLLPFNYWEIVVDCLLLNLFKRFNHCLRINYFLRRTPRQSALSGTRLLFSRKGHWKGLVLGRDP